MIVAMGLMATIINSLNQSLQTIQGPRGTLKGKHLPLTFILAKAYNNHI